MSDRRTDYQRLRRATMWSVAGGALLPWVGLFWTATAPGPPPPWQLVVAGVSAAAFTVVYWRAARITVTGTHARTEVVITGVLALVIFTMTREPEFAGAMAALAWGALAGLHVSRFTAALMTLIATAACAAFQPHAVVFYAVTISMVVWLNRFQFWFWTVVKASLEGRDAQAKLAVTEERLRFSRDLHDVVGHSLSAIAVKSELAARLASGPAAEEMLEVRRLARESLKEIRSVVRGYRTVDLNAELRSVRAVMEAAGISCALELPETALGDEVSTLLAWLVRESSTNVLRHSAATRCRIKVASTGGWVELTVSNDHPKPPSGTAGSGLAGMSERVAAHGGALTAGQSDGQFTVRARIPT
ncbi:sensor histidine kinase [Nonomuraea dietziae]|uniref:sensor histidine kinase n=1 Tax=Nonomuraea dietziae TaxID=65515 RepID=UPI00342A1B33